MSSVNSNRLLLTVFGIALTSLWDDNVNKENVDVGLIFILNLQKLSILIKNLN